MSWTLVNRFRVRRSLADVPVLAASSEESKLIVLVVLVIEDVREREGGIRGIGRGWVVADG